MELFCNDAELKRLRDHVRGYTTAFRILLAGAVILFLVLCLMIRTENAEKIHHILIISTAVTGWICIGLYIWGIRDNRRQLGHLEMLRNGEKEVREGRITLTREVIQIPKSIRIRKVLLDTGDEKPERLNLDERWVSRMAADGTPVQLAVTHNYIAGMESPHYTAGSNRPQQKASRSDIFRRIAAFIPLAAAWALAAVFISSFVFYQITDTDPANKITIYMDGEVAGESVLAARLEKGMGHSVRMVQIRSFRYFMFGTEILKTGDLYIIPDSELEQYKDWIIQDAEGMIMFDPEAGISVAGEVFRYLQEGKEPEVFRLYTGAGSPHLQDGLARKAAEILLTDEAEKEKKP
jgi:hypothetical protein